MNRLKWHNSLTIFWARVQMFAGVALGGLAFTAEILQAANVGQALPPQWAAWTLVLLGVVTELARRRKEWQGHD